MKRHLFALALLAAVISSAEANVPTTVTFAARLVDDKTDQALTGGHSATFTLFDGDVGGVQKWTETHELMPEDGMVYVDLGSSTPLDSHVFDGKQLWLQITLDGNVMEPRVPLASVPYAVRAGTAEKADDADKVGGVALDGLQKKITGTCNNGQYLKGINVDGSVVCEDDVAGVGDISAVVAGPGLEGGAPSGDATIGLMSCGANMILKSTGTGWACGPDNDSGDITGITAGPGLVGGGASGAVSLSLPTTCAAGQMLKWNGSSWGCAADTDTNSGGTLTGVTIGTPGGLIGGGTTGNVTLSLPNTCASGQMLKWSGSVWSCGNDNNAGGTITGVTAGSGLTGGGAASAVTLNVGQGVGVVVQGDSVGLDTGYTDARYMMLSGGTITGPINMSGQVLSNRGCPAGYVSAGGGLCVEQADQCCYTFSTAANRCRAAGAHLCSSTEIRGVMQSGVVLSGGVSQDWMADQDAVDTALYVDNGSDPANPDGARATTTSSWSRCCIGVE